jgi:hypothetical protein
MVALLLAGSASAQGQVVLLAAGDCRDQELLEGAVQLHQSLVPRLGERLASGAEVRSRITPERGTSASTLAERLDGARSRIFQNHAEEALAELASVAAEAERLPPGTERWRLTAMGSTVRAIALRELGRHAEAEAAMRWVLQRDPDHPLAAPYVTPDTRARFEELRREVRAAKKARLTVTSTPPGAEVFLDGFRVGRTPLTRSVLPGRYQLAVREGNTFSWPRDIEVPHDMTERVDLALQRSLFPGRVVSCLDSGTARLPEDARVRTLLGPLGAERLVLVTLERRQPGWQSLLGARVLGPEGWLGGGITLTVMGLFKPEPTIGVLTAFVSGYTGAREPPKPAAPPAAPTPEPGR